MSFWQKQQLSAAVRFLKWQYERSGSPVPEEGELNRRADELLQQARAIAKRTGKNVLTILKDLIQDLKK